MSGEYGYKTYADFERACNEFRQLVKLAVTLEQLNGLRKCLTLAYISFDRADELENIKAYQRFDYLIRCSVAMEWKKLGVPNG